MGDRYNPLFELGAGAFGKAWVVKDIITQKKYVSKVIQIKGLSSTALDRCLTEVTVLSACSHVNIVRYIEAFVNAGDLHIVMEYAAGGDLMQKIEKQNGVWFPSETVLDWFLQVVLALEYIHNRNILHRDLKPQNIFLTDNGIVKLGDFGIARVLNDCDDLALTRIGTPLYISPEICDRRPYNSSSDMWSAGCLLYQMCLLRVPFQANNFDELTRKIVKAEYEPIPRYFSPLIPVMISRLLVINPSDRLTAKELLDLEGAQEMLVFVKKKNVSIKSGQSSRPRSNSLVTNRSRLKFDHKMRSNSVDRSSKNVHEKLKLKPVVRAKDDRFVNGKTDIESEETRKRSKTPVTHVKDNPEINKDNSKDNSKKECSEKHKVEYSKIERCGKANVGIKRNDNREKTDSERGLSEYDEEQRIQGKTFTIRDSFVRTLSDASPSLAQTVCKQRFSLSISDPEALNARKKSCTEDNEEADDVFSSPCPKPTSRIKMNSLTYNISDKVKKDGNNNNKSRASSDAVNGKLQGINDAMLQALSVMNFNKELSNNILLDEIVSRTGQQRCDYLLRLVNIHIIEKGQSVESLNHIIKESESTCLPLIAMYLSLQ